MGSNRKVILALFDGLGISASYQGNAFITSDCPSFITAWKHFDHALLETVLPGVSEIGFKTEPENNYAQISTGQLSLPIYDKINHLIENGSFAESEMMTRMFSGAANQYASVHLIGSFSLNNYYSDKDHLLEILKIAKAKKFYQVFLHLIIDNSFDDAKDLIAHLVYLQTKLEQFGFGVLSSVCGQKYLSSHDDKRFPISLAFRSVTTGGGKVALSVEQAISRYLKKTQKLDELPPVSLHKNGRPIAVVRDFDRLLFFNHNLQHLERFIYSFMQHTGINNSDQMPRMVEIYTLTNRFINKHSKIRPIFERQDFNVLPDLLEQHEIKTLLISENNFGQKFCDYFCGRNFKAVKLIDSCLKSHYLGEFPAIQEKILTETVSALKTNLSDLFVLYFPFPVLATEIGGFKAATFAVKIFDKLLGALIGMATNFNSDLLVTSAYGVLDDVSKQPDYSNYYPRRSPVPFLHISKGSFSPADTTFNDKILLNEILSSKDTIYDIAPTVLDIFDVTIPANYLGKSLLKQNKKSSGD